MRTRGKAGISRLITAVFAAVLPALAFGAEAWAESKGGLSFQERAPEFDIGNATALTVSPDGKHLYATGSQTDSISVFAVTGGGSDYDYVETETDGIDDTTDAGPTVDGLRFSDDAEVSPDGKQVYVVGGLDNAVAIFDRNAATGALSFDSAVTDTVGGDDLGRPEGVAVSPDGEFVYAVSNIDDSILAFDRNPADGSLTQVEMEMDGVDDATDAGPTVDGMESPTSVVVAPDGDAVYVGTNFDDTIAVFERDQATGKLVFVEFERDGVGGVDGLNSVEDVIVSGDDDNVYATGGFDNAVAVFDRDTATEELSFVEVEKNNVDDPGDLGGTVSGLASPRQMGLSSDDRNLYIAGSSSDSVADFRRNATSGELNFVESESDGVDDPLDAGGAAAGLDGASALAVATDDANVYAGGSLESGLAVFGRGGVLGQLSFGLARPALRLPVPRGVAVSPDGAHVVLATLGDQSLRSFSRDAGTGTGALVDTETFEVDDPSDAGGPAGGLEEPRSVAFSPDGKQVYVTDTSTYSVSAYAFNSLTGELSYLESESDGVDDPTDSGGTVEGTYEPWDVAVSPDGKSVYAPGYYDDAVAAFSRDAASGKLNFAEVELDGVDDPTDAGGTVSGLSGADSVAISPDGASVYVGTKDDEAIAVFSRSAATSKLSFVEAQQSSSQGGSVADLDNVDDIAVSPDGKQLYAVGSSQLWRFDRNTTSGALTYAETETIGLSGVRTLTLSADGGEVYAGGGSPPGSIAVYSRDKSSGALAFLESETNGVDDPDDAGPAARGLQGIEAMAISPDDRFLYAAAEPDNALTLLSREDDFVAPETTITSGPADGGLTKDSTPAFGFESSESGSSFACSVDGGSAEPCSSGDALADLDDGSHDFEVSATDAEGNTDASPASRSFTVDTKVSKPKVSGADKQKVKGKKIVVKLKLKAGESAEGLGKGDIEVGKKSYGLAKVTKDLKADKSKKLKLKPAKSKHKSKIAKALKNGKKKVKAKLTGKITDDAGNVSEKKKTVTLKRK